MTIIILINCTQCLINSELVQNFESCEWLWNYTFVNKLVKNFYGVIFVFCEKLLKMVNRNHFIIESVLQNLYKVQHKICLNICFKGVNLLATAQWLQLLSYSNVITIWSFLLLSTITYIQNILDTSYDSNFSEIKRNTCAQEVKCIVQYLLD